MMSAALGAVERDPRVRMREIVHDLKNPLGAAAGYADLLADGISGPLTSQQLEMVLHIRHLIRVSLERVADLLDLVHTETAALPLVIEEIDASRLIRELIGDYQGEARQKGLALDVQVATQPLLAQTDAAAVRRIVGNLLSNALKYTPPQGRVSVSLQYLVPERPVAGGDMLIEVRDTGPGIPANQREQIFDLFFRLASTEGVTPGNGIGLSTSRRLARLLGGDISVANNDAGGAVFTVRLPCSPETQKDATLATDRQGIVAVSEAAIDDALEMTFPASDPVAFWRDSADERGTA